jgi:hypothetical protein
VCLLMGLSQQQQPTNIWAGMHSVVMLCCVLQVLPGSTEPAVLRDALHASLPQAPPADQQPVQFPAMLYTTVGRVLSPPRKPDHPGQPGMVRTLHMQRSEPVHLALFTKNCHRMARPCMRKKQLVG